jgi:ectoine hydroxylase-related dioxygenase (phytanoyl-CoA dioxygenase family)
VLHLIAPDALLQNMITLRIHLDAMTDDNGPFQVVPRSHHSSMDQGVGVENKKLILAAAGEVLAMRPLLTHASGMSKPGTHQHRRILHLEFATGPMPEPLQWCEFYPMYHANPSLET